jgi:hypothetical protein
MSAEEPTGIVDLPECDLDQQYQTESTLDTG